MTTRSSRGEVADKEYQRFLGTEGLKLSSSILNVITVIVASDIYMFYYFDYSSIEFHYPSSWIISHSNSSRKIDFILQYPNKNEMNPLQNYMCRKQQIVVNDAKSGWTASPVEKLFAENGYYHAMAIPLFYRGGLIASINCARGKEPFTERDIFRCMSISELFSVLVDNSAKIVSFYGRMPRKIVKSSDKSRSSNHIYWEVLTKRERDVLDRLLLGESYKEISDALFISKNTVKQHLKKIYRKYNVTSRSHLQALLSNNFG